MLLMQFHKDLRLLSLVACFFMKFTLVRGFGSGLVLANFRKHSLSSLPRKSTRLCGSKNYIRMDTEGPIGSAPPRIEDLHPISSAPTPVSQEWSLRNTEYGPEYVPWVWRGGRDAPGSRRPLDTTPSKSSSTSTIEFESGMERAVAGEVREQAPYPPLDGTTIALNTILVTVLKGAIDAFYQGQRSAYQAGAQPADRIERVRSHSGMDRCGNDGTYPHRKTMLIVFERRHAIIYYTIGVH